MTKKSTKRTTSRSNPKSPAKKSPGEKSSGKKASGKKALAKKAAKKSATRSEGDAVKGAKTMLSPPPAPSKEVLDILDEAFADGKCIDVAAVAEEAWFQGRDGGPRTDAYRIGRGIHARGWLCLSAQLLRCRLRCGLTEWMTRSIPAAKAADCEAQAR